MSPLVHLPPDSLSEQPWHGPARYPVTPPIRWKWAGVAVLAAIALCVLLLVASH